MRFSSKKQQRYFFVNPKLKKIARGIAHATGEGGKGNKPGSKASKRAFARLPLKVKPKKKKS